MGTLYELPGIADAAHTVLGAVQRTAGPEAVAMLPEGLRALADAAHTQLDGLEPKYPEMRLDSKLNQAGRAVADVFRSMVTVLTDLYGWGTDLFGMQTIDWLDRQFD